MTSSPVPAVTTRQPVNLRFSTIYVAPNHQKESAKDLIPARESIPYGMLMCSLITLSHTFVLSIHSFFSIHPINAPYRYILSIYFLISPPLTSGNLTFIYQYCRYCAIYGKDSGSKSNVWVFTKNSTITFITQRSDQLNTCLLRTTTTSQQSSSYFCIYLW